VKWKFKFLFLSVLALPFLLGCVSELKQESPEVARSKQIIHLSRQLESSGARVIQTGQTMRVIFSSDNLFNPRSANLSLFAPGPLDNLSQLMSILETTSVEVSAYTDVEPSRMQNVALSTGQAEAVADYLWSKGVDARLLYSVGYDSRGQFDGLPGALARNPNRRVEIQFQYLPLLTSL